MNGHSVTASGNRLPAKQKAASLWDLTRIRKLGTTSLMNGHEVLDSLYRLGAKESEANLGLARFIRALHIDALRPRLQLVGVKAILFVTESEDIVSCLFSEEAISYLLEMPNEFAFWGTVQRASIYQEIIGGPLPIGLRAAHLGYRRLVEEMALSLPDLPAPAGLLR